MPLREVHQPREEDIRRKAESLLQVAIPRVFGGPDTNHSRGDGNGLSL